MENSELIFPQKLVAEKQDGKYGRFIAEPFERGFGHTLGNSLRRMLLSSLEGSAITSCRIRGSDHQWVKHEFDTIKNVKEDVMQIILNLKTIRLKTYTQGPETLTLSVKGPKTITAAGIKENPNVEILTTDQVIATVGAGGSIEMELEVNRGRGYVTAEGNKRPYHSVDTIPMDALFSPVIKVNYLVENARVGQRIDYDRLIMEVWTDGSIMPADTLAYASKIIRDSFAVFLGEEKKEEASSSPIEVIQQEKLKELLDQPIEILGLSSRPFNCLKSAQIKTLKDLVSKQEDEVVNLRNLGEKSVDEIKEKLSEHNLTFGMAGGEQGQ
ncbi:MAG: DNA-directed RNA polymerase subunit alpha [Elusimicrobia bacterium]|nr:DNA-directed RNA polymerase subunit alpha [Elusimicrobiota bacterium]